MPRLKRTANNHFPAFTLVEIMVSLAIIAIITTASFAAFNKAREKGRDTKRVTDIHALQAALADYYRDEGSYPTSLTPGLPLVGPVSNKTYMTAVPLNPAPRDDNGCPNQDYSYQPLSNNSNYQIDFCLAGKSGDIPAGVLSAGPDKITSCISSIWSPSTAGICGSILQNSNCSNTRLATGDITCSAPLTCGGGGVANQCGCTAETDAHFCTRLNAACGSLTNTDNCGQARTVTNCGECSSGSYCYSNTCSNGLIARWRMDEGYGRTISDSSGANNNGTMVASYYFNLTGVSTVPTAGAVYSNNSQTFTTVGSKSAGGGCQGITFNGTGDPAVSGTLTKVSGTGDATLYYDRYSSTWASNMWSSDIPALQYGNNYGLKINSAYDYVSTANNFATSGIYSISFWYKHAPITRYSTDALIELSPNFNSNNAFAISFNDNSGGNNTIGGFVFSMHGSAGHNIQYTPGRYDDNNWHNIIVIFDRTQSTYQAQTKVYIDNSLISLNTLGAYNKVMAENFGAYPLYIGNRFNDSYASSNSLIDDLRIYNYALSPAQASAIATGNAGPTDYSGYWKFDEGAGQTVTDSSGNGHTGTLFGQPPYLQYGNTHALEFNGSSQYVEAGPVEPKYFTISSWINFSGQGSHSDGSVIIANSPQLYGGAVQYSIDLNYTTKKIIFGVQTNTGTISSAKTLDPNTWYNVVCTYDGSYRKIYINGVLDTSSAYTSDPVYPTSGNRNVQIGRWGYSSFTRYFQGMIDDVAIYNRALSSNEILSIYNETNRFYGFASCGDTGIYYGEAYPTVQIGTQCWMKKNMNIGSMVIGSASQANNGHVEKYCYGDNPASCSANGGLYQWDEAMRYSLDNASQGICPAGWHIPSETEMQTLDSYLTSSGQSCDPSRYGWGCNGAGTSMKTGGASGFDAILAGYRFTGGTFGAADIAPFWSSTPETTNARYRGLQNGYTGTYRDAYPKGNGFYVRCIMN